MAVDGIAVKAHLGIEAFQITLVGHDQRVDLEHLHVLVGEGLVEGGHQRHALLDLIAGKPEREGDAAAVERLIAGRGIDRKADDLFGGRSGDLFDVHAALGRTDKGDAAGRAVHEKGEVKLGLDARPVLDIDAVHGFAGRAGLVCDQRAAQHLFRFLRGLFDRFRQAHATLFAGVGLLELALAAAAGVDLRLDHPERPVKLARGGLGLFGAQHRAAVADRGAIAAQQGLGLIFMDVHLSGSLPLLRRLTP